MASVLNLYVRLPGTRHAPSRQDRRLALALHDRGVPLAVVRTALLLAAARRTLRRTDAVPLAPIGCLHYFLPVIDEVSQIPPEPHYIDYLAAKLDPFMKRAADPAPNAGQKTSLPAGR
jgi:hypothetical protein